MSDKTYVGSGKEITTQFGKILKMSFSEKDVTTLKDKLNENGWVNVDILPRREPSERGATHYGVVNEWKPQPQDGGGESAPAPKKTEAKEESSSEAKNDAEEVSAEDLPF